MKTLPSDGCSGDRREISGATSESCPVARFFVSGVALSCCTTVLLTKLASYLATAQIIDFMLLFSLFTIVKCCTV